MKLLMLFQKFLVNFINLCILEEILLLNLKKFNIDLI